MTRFMSERYRYIAPYDTTGEHEAGSYIRLNTNESPFQPSPRAVSRIAEAAKSLNFYPDPDGRELSAKIAALYGLSEDEVLLTCFKLRSRCNFCVSGLSHHAQSHQHDC